MIVQFFLNTDGFLGAWSISPKKLAGSLLFDIPQTDIPLLHKAVDGRAGVKILPLKAKKFDAQFGNLKLKFEEDQTQKFVDLTQEAHKYTKKKNAIEDACFS